MGKANAAFSDVCTQLYRNPRAAWAEIDNRLKAGETFDDIDLDTVGKKRGWAFFGYNSHGRKHANAAKKGVPRAHKRLEKLRTQWEIQDHSELELHAKRGASEHNYNEAIATVGS